MLFEKIMKNLKVLSVLIVCFVIVSAATATNLSKEFKDYEISEVADLFVGKKVKAIWTLSYSNEEIPVTVVKRKTLEGAEYVVSSKYFEVSYAATANGFGTKEVRKSWSNVSPKITKAVICKHEMKKQTIITPNKVNDKQALDLIANYLPDLLNDTYTHLLN